MGSIDWLHVEEAMWWRGLARLLLSRVHLHKLGCDTCWLRTGAENWSAQPLYLSLGHEVVDGPASYMKTLR